MIRMTGISSQFAAVVDRRRARVLAVGGLSVAHDPGAYLRIAIQDRVGHTFADDIAARCGSRGNLAKAL